MNRNELIAKAMAMLSEDQNLMNGFAQLISELKPEDEADGQKENTMYVLCVRFKVENLGSVNNPENQPMAQGQKNGEIAEERELAEPVYHYHPLVWDNMLLDKRCVENKIICSTDLVALQEKQRNYNDILRSFPLELKGTLIILALPMERFIELQNLLDEMVNAMMKQLMAAAQQVMGTKEYTTADTLKFENMYGAFLMELMKKSQGILGAGLNASATIIPSISNVSYEGPLSSFDDTEEEEKENYEEDEDDDDEDDGSWVG